MKTAKPSYILELNLKQKIIIALFGIVGLFGVLTFEVTQQIDQSETKFHQNADLLIKKQTAEQQRISTILETLSEYYTSQLIKNSSEFTDFAQSLLNKSSNNIIGLATLIARDQKTKFEQTQHGLGYESFKISNSQLFKQQHENTKHAFLTITTITPLKPKNAIYLSEDLFSIPDLVNKFTQAIQSNQTQHKILISQKDGTVNRLSFKPIYLNSPQKLSHEERLKQVRGIVFTVQPIEEITLKHAAEFFSPENTGISLSLYQNSEHSVLKQIQTLENHQDLESTILPKRTFESQLTLPYLQADQQIKIHQVWNLQNLKIASLLKVAALTLTIFVLLLALILILVRYTQNLHQTQSRLNQILKTSQDAVILTTQKGNIIDWNPEAEQLFGFSKQEAIGQPIASLIFEQYKSVISNSFESDTILEEGFAKIVLLDKPDSTNQKIEVKLHNRSGDVITAEIAKSILHIKGQIEVGLFIKDISYQRRTEEAMTQMAFYDPLTKLENRAYFKKTIDELVDTSPSNNFAILFMDLDGFKQVNDTLGHSVGDELLIVIAKRIKNALRNNNDNNHICRFGGDEFVIMLENVDETGAAKISLRLLNQIERVIKIEADELQVSASIGIALYPQHGEDVDTLLRHADTAMYQSKDIGKNTYSLYHDSMEEDLAERILIEKHLRNAIKNREFNLVYQPQVNLQTGKIIGLEALIRWNNPILGFVPPDKFIPIAEESNLILNIGEWVTQTCIEQLQSWKNTSFDNLHIAMNVSSVQFESPYFLNFVSTLMENSGLKNHLLEIELTERTVMGNVNENIERFNEIRSSGFGLSVDDFGTGYSSLSYLKKFPLSILKVDKTFVDGIPDDDDDKSIVTAILNLAHSLNMRVVAEGIETQEQMQYLQDLHCDFGQGYHISRPKPIEELETWLTENQHYFFKSESRQRTLEYRDV